MTNLGEGSRKRPHRRPAGLHQGGQSSRLGTFEVRKPKVPEGVLDVTVRESPDELTLRAEEVNTWKALIDVNHIEPERWGPPLFDADWYAFCQASYQDIEGKDWEEVCDFYKAMSKALGVTTEGRRQEPCRP